MSERAVDEAYSDLVSDQSRGCLLLLVLMNEHVACLLAGGRENVMLITTTDPRNNPAPNDNGPGNQHFRLRLGFVRETGLEYTVSEIFQYSNNNLLLYEYSVANNS